MNDDTIITYWAQSMRAQNCTDRTITDRMTFIRSMLRHTNAESITAVTKQQLVMFLGRPGLTGRTRQNYRSCLHTFFTWVQDEEIRLDNPAARLPRPRPEPKEPNPVTTENIQTVLDSGIRGATIMKVLLYSYEGLRASEIAAVSGANIDWERGRLLTREGKGRKEVWRPLHSITLEHARAAGYSRTDYWFPSRIGGHTRGKSVSNTLCAAFRRAGINHKAHDMRKWHGTTLLSSGADSIDVQHSLRHSDGQSMRAYVLPNEERMRAAKETLPRVKVPMIRRRRRMVRRVAA